MKTIEIHIQLDPSVDGISWVNKDEIEGNYALIIGTNGKYRVVDKAEAKKIFDKLGEDCRIDFMGSSDFMVVYNDKKKLKVGDSMFLAGSVLIVKSGDRGIDFLTDDDIEKARTEFGSRILTLYADGINFSAYEMY